MRRKHFSNLLMLCIKKYQVIVLICLVMILVKQDGKLVTVVLMNAKLNVISSPNALVLKYKDQLNVH